MAMHPWEEGHWLPGVLSRRQIKTLCDEGYLFDFDIPIENEDNSKEESSVDLTLTGDCYKMKKGSLKPHGGVSYKKILNNENLSEKIDPVDKYFHLETKSCYVFKLKERLTCKLKNIYGQATAKSSIGRLDVIARLIVDGEYQYENFDFNNLGDSNGEMYLEIIPTSFNIQVKENDQLSQLRLFYGRIEDSEIHDNNFIKSILLG